MLHHRITYRISYRYVEDREALEQLKAELARNRSGYDDLAIQTSFTHGVLDTAETLRRIRLIGEVAKELRPLADKVGIVLLTTIGHHPENYAMAPKEGYTQLTDMYGNTAPCTCCHNDPRYREQHLKPIYEAIAREGLDFYWNDDDVRYLGHGMLMFVCFCDHCMKLFNAENGTAFTREELLRKLDSPEIRERLRYRRLWLEFSGRSVISLFRFTERTIHAIAPEMQLCSMDAGMHMGDNSPYEEESRTLQGAGGRAPAPRWRPGGGSYDDHALLTDAIAVKSHQLGFEAALLPDFVTDIESETESFSYQRLEKSAAATQFESALYTAAGVTGTTLNILCDCDDFQSSANGEIMASMTQVAPFLREMTRCNGRQRPQGIWNGRNGYYGALFGLMPGDSWGKMKSYGFSEVTSKPAFYAGLPPAYRAEEAAATILYGNNAWTFSDEELRKLFAGGVFCDGRTIQILEERGLAHLTGFRRGGDYEGDSVERFCQHPLTEGLLKLQRDSHLPLPVWLDQEGGCHKIIPAAKEAVVLARLEDYTGAVVSECSCGIYENELGGRVAVAGYCPLSNALFASRIEFLKRLFRWLSRETLPAYVASFHRIVLWARPGTSVSLANASLDAATNVDIRVKDGALQAKLVLQDGSSYPVTGTRLPDGYVQYLLPRPIPPFTVALLKFS